MRLLICICECLFLALMLVAGQSITGSVSGTVVDPSGATFVGAKVQLTNVSTGQRTMATE
jgi:hypothetical protein